MAITGWPLTLEQFLALPEAEPALEYGPDGQVSQKMSPESRHSRLQKWFVVRITNYAEPRHLGEALPELRVNTGGASLVPDVAFYRPGRVPPTGYPTAAPELAIEIASPGQSRDELAEKCRWYVDQGSTLALLVDPEDRSISAFSAGQTQTLRGADLLPVESVLPGLELSVDEIFSALA
jgi:Uma2 family endonuclease